MVSVILHLEEVIFDWLVQFTVFLLLLFQVYTSGKGSSAAGLTASVMRDPASVSSPS